MDPELSRKAARIVHTPYCLSLDYRTRLNLIKDIGKAAKVSDLTPENQKIWRKAEEDIRAGEERDHLQRAVGNSSKKIAI